MAPGRSVVPAAGVLRITMPSGTFSWNAFLGGAEREIGLTQRVLGLVLGHAASLGTS